MSLVPDFNSVLTLIFGTVCSKIQERNSSKLDDLFELGSIPTPNPSSTEVQYGKNA